MNVKHFYSFLLEKLHLKYSELTLRTWCCLQRDKTGESWSHLRTLETECKQSEESFLETLQDLTEPMPWGLLPIGLWIWEHLSKVKGYFNQILSDLVLGILSAQRKVWPCLVQRQSTSLYQNAQQPNEENICAIESVKSKRILEKIHVKYDGL